MHMFVKLELKLFFFGNWDFSNFTLLLLFNKYNDKSLIFFALHFRNAIGAREKMLDWFGSNTHVLLFIGTSKSTKHRKRKRIPQLAST